MRDAYTRVMKHVHGVGNRSCQIINSSDRKLYVFVEGKRAMPRKAIGMAKEAFGDYQVLHFLKGEPADCDHGQGKSDQGQRRRTGPR